MKDQLRKRMFKKRKVRRIYFIIASGVSIELNTYALVRPTNPGLFIFVLCMTSKTSLISPFLFSGTITWLDSITNLPIKVLNNEKLFILNWFSSKLRSRLMGFSIWKSCKQPILELRS